MRGWVFLWMGGLAACGASADDGATASAAAGHGGGHVGGEGGALGGGGVGGSPSRPTVITMPQLVDGAALANPSVFPSVALHILTDPPADHVDVEFGAATIVASGDGAGRFNAELPIGALPVGTASFDVRATLGDEVSTAAGELVLSITGAQLTDFATVGSAGTPRIHRRDDALWLTWTDRREGDAEAWLQRIDGAARFMGDPMPLVGAAEETLSARVAFGNTTIGILYQGLGGPYVNHFKIVDFEGNEVLAPVDLDGAMFGSFGGDIAFDGDAFVFVWRVNDGAGNSTIRWMRRAESGAELAGPVTVATAGNDDPHGGFQPTTFVSVRPIGDRSVVSFVRDWHHPTLDLNVPKSQVAMVTHDGTVETTDFLSSEMEFTFHREARLFTVGSELIAMWSAVDLLDSNLEPPNLLFGARSDGSGAFSVLGKGLVVVDAPGDRDEPFVVPHPEHRGVMVWTDNRGGSIELYAATLADDMSRDNEKVFVHSAFIASTAELNAIDAGGNAIMLWRDERHGNGILDPRPELWMETAWY